MSLWVCLGVNAKARRKNQDGYAQGNRKQRVGEEGLHRIKGCCGRIQLVSYQHVIHLAIFAENHDVGLVSEKSQENQVRILS